MMIVTGIVDCSEIESRFSLYREGTQDKHRVRRKITGNIFFLFIMGNTIRIFIFMEVVIEFNF